MTRPLSTGFLLLSLMLGACSQQPPGTGAATPATARSPWSATALPANAVPAVFHQEWREADNRDRCALLAPARIDPTDAIPRAATFSGGWAVAYDLPSLRSAFGIAGSGATADGDVYDEWPHRRTYADGSRVGYGLEGGSGPNWLAYVRVPGQQCLYNVWSRRGQAHLEALLEQLRFVASP